jgi:uncharacterized membrane-anchored protein YhcB (DUF1043 family)
MGISEYTMPSPASFSSRERQLRSRLHLLITNAQGFIHGSVIEMTRKCGSPSCRCASDDDFRHRSRYLGQTRDGKKSMVYLPADLEAPVRQEVEHFQQALDLLEELNIEARLRLDKKKLKGKSAHGVAKKITAKKITAKKRVSKKASSKKKASKKKPPKKKDPGRS